MTDPDVLMAADAAVPRLSQSYTRAEMHADFLRVFGSADGRRVLGHLLVWCGLTGPATRIDGATASEAALIHEGRRSVGLKLLLHLDRIAGNKDEEVVYGGDRR